MGSHSDRLWDNNTFGSKRMANTLWRLRFTRCHAFLATRPPLSSSIYCSQTTSYPPCRLVLKPAPTLMWQALISPFAWSLQGLFDIIVIYILNWKGSSVILVTTQDRECFNQSNSLILLSIRRILNWDLMPISNSSTEHRRVLFSHLTMWQRLVDVWKSLPIKWLEMGAESGLLNVNLKNKSNWLQTKWFSLYSRVTWRRE